MLPLQYWEFDPILFEVMLYLGLELALGALPSVLTLTF